MKNIDQVIAELVALGNRYPEKPSGYFFGFFGGHHNQEAAKLLISFPNNVRRASSSADKITMTQDLIYQLYHEKFSQLGGLIKSVHKILMEGDDFVAYRNKYQEIYNKNAGYNLAIAQSAVCGGAPKVLDLEQYKEMASVYKPEPERELSLIKP